MKQKNILILGSGAWATALANVLIINDHKVTIYGIDKSQISDLKNAKNSKFFGEQKLNKPPFLATTKIAEAFKNQIFDIILIATPTFAISNVLEISLKYIFNKPLFINVSKGLNKENNKPWSYYVKKKIKGKNSGLIDMLGPTFAIDVFEKHYTVLNVVGSNHKTRKIVCETFSNSFFKCVPLKDVNGAEIISSLKNVAAIACGMTFGLHTSINTRAAILTQAAKEISIIMKKFKGSRVTLLEACGIGDIFLTCTDKKSRNFSFGLLIAEKGVLIAKKSSKDNTIEGLFSLNIVKNIIDRDKLHCPVFLNLFDVINNKAKPEKFVEKVISCL